MINISNYIDTKSIKQDITFVYIHRDEKNLYTVATDSYRLACIAYPLDTDLYNNINDGYYTVKYFTSLCKDLNAKKSTIIDKQNAINSFNATKSTLDLKYPEYQQLIKKYQENKRTGKVQQGIIGKYNAKYLIDFIKLSSELKDFNIHNISYKIGDIDILLDITSMDHLPAVYQKDDSYIMLMPLHR